VAFAPGGKTLATASKGVVKLWQVTTGEELLALKGPPDEVLRLAFAPDGKALLGGYFRGAVVRWDAATDEQVEAQAGKRAARKPAH
jgi:WD40 repeat protein